MIFSGGHERCPASLRRCRRRQPASSATARQRKPIQQEPPRLKNISARPRATYACRALHADGHTSTASLIGFSRQPIPPRSRSLFHCYISPCRHTARQCTCAHARAVIYLFSFSRRRDAERRWLCWFTRLRRARRISRLVASAYFIESRARFEFKRGKIAAYRVIITTIQQLH